MYDEPVDVDGVIGPPEENEITIFVEKAAIAGEKPPVFIRCSPLFRIDIAEADITPLDADDAVRSCWQPLTTVVENPDLHAVCRTPLGVNFLGRPPKVE